jgi:hypothetical protein
MFLFAIARSRISPFGFLVRNKQFPLTCDSLSFEVIAYQPRRQRAFLVATFSAKLFQKDKFILTEENSDFPYLHLLHA